MNAMIKKGLALFLLIRPLNLAFIALTQYLLFYKFLFPALKASGAPTSLDGWRAVFFLCTTTLLTGAGYAINDLYDVDTDRINKPRRWLIGNRLSRAEAVNWTLFLLLFGAGLAAFLAWDIQKPLLWLIYPFVAGCLWVYSRYLKGIPLAGNLLVAGLCMLVGGIAWFAEREGLAYLHAADPLFAERVVRALILYLSFAFLATLFRELIKDCEDLEGDAATGQQTLPVRIGLDRARTWALILGLLLAGALFLLTAYFWQTAHRWGTAYSLLLLALPHFVGMGYLYRAQLPLHYKKISMLAKWVIFAGVFLILFFP